MNSENKSSAGKWDSVADFLVSGLGCYKEIVDSGVQITNAFNSLSTTKTNNAVNLNNAETEANKESNRHAEEMAKIQKEIDEIRDDARSKEEKDRKVQQIIDMFKKQMERHLADENVNHEAIEKLNKILFELAIELLK